MEKSTQKMGMGPGQTPTNTCQKSRHFPAHLHENLPIAFFFFYTVAIRVVKMA